MSVLLWLESTAIGTFVREHPSLLAYPTFTVFHTVGLAIVVGLSVVVAARTVGFAPSIPLAPLNKLFPVIWFGFGINLLSGGGLAAAAATTTIPNPMFLAKITFVIAGVVVMRMLQVRVFRNPEVGSNPLEGKAKILAGSLLVLWLFAMIAGRLIGYTVDIMPPMFGE